MKKQITILLVFLFSITVTDQAGNNFPGHLKTSELNLVSKENLVRPAAQKLSTQKEIGIRYETLNRIDSIVKDGIRARAFPGCQVLVLKDGKPIYDKCFGNYTYESVEKVKPTTMYDLASLSKTTGTLLAIMKLYDEGKLKLTDKASTYLSFLRGTNKENITISELLFHESGLPAGLPFYNLVVEKKSTPTFSVSTKDTMCKVQLRSNTLKYKENWVSKIPSGEYTLQVSDSFYLHKRFHEAAMQMIAHSRLNNKTYVYSCINFILLKEIAETISGSTLDEFLYNEFYTPMKLNNITYLPLRTHKKEDIAPTLKRDFLRNGVIQGYVHDPDAAFLGGVSGNAGLFATARDVATVYQMLLNNGELDGKRYLSAETCKLFTTTTSASGRRGLGFDKPIPANPLHSSCCASAPSAVYGHTGYTGTCCWVDPINKLVYVFLSNRTYPNDGVNKLAKMSIRPKIQEVIYQSIK
ncbi:MAG: serine hydrolase [Paludibacter sp.]|nr:serine hydrolase [Paludibacter sp.]